MIRAEMITPGPRPTPDSIKNLMWAWWTTLLASFPKEETLKKKFNPLFKGDFNITVETPEQWDEESCGETFSITISEANEGILNDAIDLLRVSTMLGGIGQRAEKGYGSILVRPEFSSAEEIADLLNRICQCGRFRFERTDRHMVKSHAIFPGELAIEEILLGRPVPAKEITKRISRAITEMEDLSETYEASIGLSNRFPQRTPSVLVSATRMGGKPIPVVVILTPCRKRHRVDNSLRRQFAREII